MKLVFATHNAHKIEEAIAKIKSNFDIVSLSDLNCNEDIPETADTLEGNALIKAEYVFNKYNLNVFADDTGLEVEALDGKPGVFSSRYAGEHVTYDDNMNKLLADMIGIENRKARFRTVIHLILDGNHYSFEGIVNGTIIKERHGSGGFGYDPIFMPDGYDKTFAELTLETKNSISHRGRALEKLSEFLKAGR